MNPATGTENPNEWMRLGSCMLSGDSHRWLIQATSFVCRHQLLGDFWLSASTCRLATDPTQTHRFCIKWKKNNSWKNWMVETGWVEVVTLISEWGGWCDSWGNVGKSWQFKSYHILVCHCVRWQGIKPLIASKTTGSALKGSTHPLMCEVCVNGWIKIPC